MDIDVELFENFHGTVDDNVEAEETIKMPMKMTMMIY